MKNKSRTCRTMCLLLVVLVASPALAWAETIYVNANAVGAANGSSWTDAYPLLQDALLAAQDGDQLWIAAGIYKPDQGGGQVAGDRNASFVIPNGVEVYGGFAGTETQLGHRDVVANATILSGDLLGDDIPDLAEGLRCYSGDGLAIEQSQAGCAVYDVEPPGGDGDVDCADLNLCDNAYRVASANDTDASTIIDGLQITAGNADVIDVSQSAAGLGLGGATAATIVRSCAFRRNFAIRFGGAISTSGSVSIIDCQFIENRTFERGGAIIVFGGGPLIQGCMFERNIVNDDSDSGSPIGFGGAIFSNTSDGLRILDCDFNDNTTDNNGGAVYLRNGMGLVDDCRFNGNVARSGAGIFVQNSDSLITQCSFMGNNGGCVYVSTGQPVIERCEFVDNLAEDGAAVENGVTQGDNALILIDCEFIENVGDASFGSGGAVSIRNSNLPHLISGCRFTRNTCDGDGGALGLKNADLFGVPIATITNCIFEGNIASLDCGQCNGGAIENDGILTCVNTVFVGNQAVGITPGGNSSVGGAVVNRANGDAQYINCAFVRNEVGVADNGGAVSGLGINVTASNCIFWDNRAGGVLNHIRGTPFDPGELSYSIIQDDDPNDATVPFDGATYNNSDDDPLFVRLPDPGGDGLWDGVNDDYGDLRLMAGSPALDAGNNDAVSDDATDVDCDGNVFENTPFDVTGNPRFVDDVVIDTGNGPAPVIDIGPYERGPLTGTRFYVNGAANGANDGSSWQDAYTDLQAALAVAAGNSCGAVEIWVAAGSYTPDSGSSDRNATFLLQDNVGILGGFNGTEVSAAERDPVANPTILSGDLLGNDDGTPASITDNSFHVVTGTGVTATALLDGLIISGGNADNPTSGGGFLTFGGGPTLRNCILRDNVGDCAPQLDSSGGIINVDGLTVELASSMANNGLGLSQSRLTLAGDLNIDGGRLDIYEANFGGPGSVNVAAGATLKIKNVAACDAELITRSVGQLSSATFFTGGDEPTWDIADSNLSDVFVLGADTSWVIGPSWDTPATLSWTGHILEADASNNGLAEAAFLGGGELTITGRVYDDFNQGTANLLFDGVLLSAQVASFQGQETTVDSDTLEFTVVPELTPTGGFLVTNDLGFQLLGRQQLTLTASPALQDGLVLTDFLTATSMAWVGQSQINIAPTNPPQGATTVSSRIEGNGDIEIDAGASLILSGTGRLNLSGQPEDACNGQDEPGITAAGGSATVNGSLVVQDEAEVQNTSVNVKLLCFEAENRIVHNDIRLVEASSSFGGEFFVSGDATISCNDIVSEGDRYLDLDPDPADGFAPNLVNNKITVIIKQGVDLEQGELLELRAEDLDFNIGGGASGHYQLNSSAGFDGVWALDRLEVEPGAKLTLTNRQGFVFQDPGITIPETVYVRNLVLGANAILNTGLQRIYYQTLVMGAGAEIVDTPLLGFSLVNITMEDEAEFGVRVQRRLTNDDDLQLDPPALPKRGSIQRLDDGFIGGYMEMKTRADGEFDSASSVAAHGAFARAAEDEILVTFNYRFCGNSSDELVVYLSQSSRIDDIDPADRVEIARLMPPEAGRPGSTGSDKLATFYGIFPRGNLNFTRGTYIQLELLGLDACVEIDDWDPQINCTYTCQDYSGDDAVSNRDFLLLVAEYGKVAGAQEGCLDNYLLSSDQYIDFGDLISWDTFFNNPSATSTCGLNLTSPTTEPTPPLLAANRLIISGKPDGMGIQEDSLYQIDLYGVAAPNAQLPASAPAVNGYRANTRFAKDADGVLYQLHATQGLIRLENAAVALPPIITACDGSNINGCLAGDSVVVGVHPTFDGFGGFVGAPLTDVAFSKTDPNIAHIAPVIIEPFNQSCPYRAVAKVQLNPLGDGTYQPPTILAVYGENPSPGSSTLFGGCFSVPEPERSRVREVEVDASGNVFVTTAHALNDNDWLIVYDEASTAPIETISLSVATVPVPAPSSMLISADGLRLWVCAGTNDPTATATEVFEFNVTAATGAVTYAGQYTVNNMRNVVELLQDPATGEVIVVGFTAPAFADNATFDDLEGLFTTPTLATLPSSFGAVTASTIDALDLVLPISAAFNETALCLKGDADGNGTVELADVADFVQQLVMPTASDDAAICANDLNGDETIDGADIQGFVATLID